jgi:formylglycine-generating enzyme required for sulfatase activity
MAANLNRAGISRIGSPSTYTYSPIGSPNHPITFVNWGDAARFANWLNNGQPIGLQNASTTEDGAYTLNGATTDLALSAIPRNPGAKYFIPSEDEWYKAAYYDPSVTHYWTYPTRTDSTPTSAPPPGAANTANFKGPNGYAVTGSNSLSSSQNYLTDVGAYSLSASPYGTFDQGGNVWEWNEAILDTGISGSIPDRGIRGGAWSGLDINMKAGLRNHDPASTESSDFGFRIATVPEPTTFALAAIGLVILAVGRRNRSGGG